MLSRDGEVKYISMRIFFICLVIMSAMNCSLSAQTFFLKGLVLDKESNSAIEPAVVTLPDLQLWAVTDEKGQFTLSGISPGLHRVDVSCLGYEKQELKIEIRKNTTDVKFLLSTDNLALQEVVITAKENKSNAGSGYLIDKAALEHHQMSNVADLSTLLPGGKTAQNSDLATTSAKRFEIRSAAGELGNPSFMTAVEVDGIRLSNNASFTETAGVDSRNIATSNIESVEVISGIPSVEYGDVSSGIVKVKTQKGDAPLRITVAASPKTKQFSLSKGVALGYNRGILNFSAERTKSIADIASPYTSYVRNAATVTYSNTLWNSTSMPLRLTATVAGNMGGYDSKADPDAFKDTYTKLRDHNLRGSVALDWQLNLPFLTGIELKSSLNYSDKLQKINKNKSSSTATPVFHGKEEGYFVASDYDTDPDAAVTLIPAGYWYELGYRDDRPLESNTDLKLHHHFSFGNVLNKVKAGASFSTSANKGRGEYYDDPRYAPTWREYRYSDIPMLSNMALFAEYMMNVPMGRTNLQLTAGIRRDVTAIDESDYGTVGAWSPRFNAKYSLVDQPTASLLKSLTIRAGVGDAVKLPSFAILYPEPNYRQQLTFAPGAMSDGTAYYAYYITPTSRIANPELEWQFTRQGEVGIEGELGRVRFSLSAYRNKGYNGYSTTSTYSPFTYKFTDQKALNGTDIPLNDRVYSVDKQTGVVTVSDKTGKLPVRELPYTERTTFRSEEMASNTSPILREGVEWVADFGKIPSLYTSLRLDGSYYHYRGVNETLTAHLPTSSQTMANGAPYKYIGYFAGGNSASNGSETRRVNANATFTTHIPKMRLIVSLRIESTLFHASRNLSEYSGGSRGVVLNDRNDYIGTNGNIYAGDQYVAVYPLYYVSADDMNTRIPFLEKFLDAKENDPALYNELAKLVAKSNTSYYFNENRISPYFSANLSVTKEIGKHFSLSFYANNFLNNLSKVTSSWNDTESTLYDSSRIPGFYYGMTLRVKL